MIGFNDQSCVFGKVSPTETAGCCDSSEWICAIQSVRLIADTPRASSVPSIHAPGKLPARQDQVGQSEQRVELGGVFGQSSVTDLSILEEVFKDLKRMLHTRSDLRLKFLEPFGGLLQLAFCAAPATPRPGPRPDAARGLRKTRHRSNARRCGAHHRRPRTAARAPHRTQSRCRPAPRPARPHLAGPTAAQNPEPAHARVVATFRLAARLINDFCLTLPPVAEVGLGKR